MSKEKQGIDLLKFIGSIMIFTIHMAVFESFGEVQSAWELLGRWAVPVFFVFGEQWQCGICEYQKIYIPDRNAVSVLVYIQPS